MPVSEVMEGVKALRPEEFHDLGNQLSQNLSGNQSSEVLTSMVDNMTIESKKRTISEVASKLSRDEQMEVAKSLGMGVPSGKTRDKLWTIAVSTFAVVMGIAVLALAIGIFVSRPATPIASGEILISVFTAAVGFFAGLFAPSPGQGS